MAKPIPDGYHAITPALVVKNGAEAMEFYKRAFGAEEVTSFPGPNGRLMHAELKIGDSRFMLGEEAPEQGCRAPVSVGGASSSLYLYVQDADKAFRRAVEAGAKTLMPVTDMFWGDRFGQVEDPSGHRWSLATHKEDLSPAEIVRRQQQFFAQQGQPKK